MKFKDYVYERPDLKRITERFEILLEEFKDSQTLDQQNNILRQINEVRNNIETMSSLVHIRHSIDTEDEFYERENNFMDENEPKIEKLTFKFYKELVKSKFRDELEELWGEQIFNLAELQIQTFSEEIMDDLVAENKLITEYNKLIASAQLEFKGDIRNLSDMRPFLESKDRLTRKSASETMWGFFQKNESEFDRIYDELVKRRHKMAKTLGFSNYVEMGYKKLGRTDYNSKMVENYRKQVYEDLVPLVSDLNDRQKKRLGLEDMNYYDELLEYNTGNATPHGDSDWIIENGMKMYKELSSETDKFFTFMKDRELLDLLSKKGKMAGGYCTIIPDYRSPFIFSNFNGTSGDIDVLTHEAGHAFQFYMSMDYELPEYRFPTLEACEIHSKSMEFLTWPWMELFFKDESEKYKFSHLSGAISFIPYGVTVDEFQHYVYENPEASPDERKSKWRQIEKKYLPFKNYDESEFLDRGTYWFKQGHIFGNPFYYIDYTLAQVCAFQFWIKNKEDEKTAWKDYLRLCKAGGSKSFLGLVELSDLENPFVDGTIKKTVKPLSDFLNSIDDSKF